jgi:hypothetical protein
MLSPRPYQYKPLQHPQGIRLLHIKPASKAADIHLSITLEFLDQDPTYEALSYTWGDPRKTESAICNEAGNTLSITQNCDAALRRLRQEDRQRTVWIDQLCINQEDVLERNHQVQLMTKIYQQAKTVLAYLGEAFDDSDLGMEFVSEHARSIPKPSAGLSLGTTSSPQQRAIDRILGRPYFERVWILQEIECAREVEMILGDKTVDWKDFSSSVTYVETNKELHWGSRYRGRTPSIVFYRDSSRVERPKTLLQFLNDTRNCKSSDPRDKVFALLGMTPEAAEQALAPNYSTPTRDVFISLVKFLISRDKNLDVLCHVQNPTSVDGLPSWVPDWSCPRTSRALGYPRPSKWYYKTALDSPAAVEFLPGSEILAAQGKAVDKISQVGPRYEMGAESSSPTLRQWQEIALTVPRDPLGKDQQTAFLETLIASPPYAVNPFVQRFSASWTSEVLYERSVDDQSVDLHKASEAAIFQRQVNKACGGRRFFMTERGYIGLGPAELQHGQLVTVLLGGQVPFVLCEREERVTLVGECYVHGFMNGEAIKDASIEGRTFWIR